MRPAGRLLVKFYISAPRFSSPARFSPFCRGSEWGQPRVCFLRFSRARARLDILYWIVQSSLARASSALGLRPITRIGMKSNLNKRFPFAFDGRWKSPWFNYRESF